MRIVNDSHIEIIFSESQHALLTKILTKTQYFYSGKKLKKNENLSYSFRTINGLYFKIKCYKENFVCVYCI